MFHLILLLYCKNWGLYLLLVFYPIWAFVLLVNFQKANAYLLYDNMKRFLHVLDLVHSDLWGPSLIPSTNGFLYYATFVDDFSRFTWLYLMKNKLDFPQILSNFLIFLQTQFSWKVKIFQSDGGTAFINHHFAYFLLANGTHHRVSYSYTLQQNGRVERKHHHIIETSLAMLFNAQAPTSPWVDAFVFFVFIINRLTSKVLQYKIPFELLYSTVPNYDLFRVFSCRLFRIYEIMLLTN